MNRYSEKFPGYKVTKNVQIVWWNKLENAI